MAFNSNFSRFNNQQQQQHSVNTNSVPMYNGDDCLKITFMNDSIMLSFIHVVMRDDGTRSFPNDNAVKCCIKLEYAMLLLNWIDAYFIPEAKSNFDKQMADPSVDLKPVVVGIPLNKDNTNMLVFEYDKPSPEGALAPYVVLHTDIGEDRTPSNSADYHFGFKRIFTWYDPETGDYEHNMDQVQFWVFVKCLRNFVDASTYAMAHGDKVVNNFVNKEMRSLIRQIAQKNGIQTITYNNGFDAGSSSNGGISANVPTSSNVTSIEAMLTPPNLDEPPF